MGPEGNRTSPGSGAMGEGEPRHRHQDRAASQKYGGWNPVVISGRHPGISAVRAKSVVVAPGVGFDAAQPCEVNHASFDWFVAPFGPWGAKTLWKPIYERWPLAAFTMDCRQSSGRSRVRRGIPARGCERPASEWPGTHQTAPRHRRPCAGRRPLRCGILPPSWTTPRGQVRRRVGA